MVNSISQNWYQSFLQNADIHVLKKILVCLGRGLQRQAHLPIFAFYDHMDI